MGVDRRDFLKIAGFAAAFGLGGKAAIDILAPGELEAATEGVPLTQGKRWSMVIDMRKCLKRWRRMAAKNASSPATKSIMFRIGEIQGTKSSGSGRRPMNTPFPIPRINS